jgi:hypothetical protein
MSRPTIEFIALMIGIYILGLLVVLTIEHLLMELP